MSGMIDGYTYMPISAEETGPASSTNPQTLKSVSLFTGAGGLDVGLEAAGFSCSLCVENDTDALATLSSNKAWPHAEPGDIHLLSPESILEQSGLAVGEVSLLAGGPPCQPFSKAAYWSNRGVKGMDDPRARTIEAYVDVVGAVLPEAILLENVAGIANRKTGHGAYEAFCAGLTEINRTRGCNYEPQVIHVNAADYGIPQHRHRVFIFASRVGESINLPNTTHGNMDGLHPFATAWDAIGDLDDLHWSKELELKGKWAELVSTIPEGKNYLWHTPRGGGESLFGWRTRFWSFLLKLSKKQPSWTIPASPGPATGPFHWRNRLLSVRELARLQTFPDSYVFPPERRLAQKQIGNAVPCALGELLGLTIRRELFGERHLRIYPSMIPASRGKAPRAHPRRKVPERFMSLVDSHLDHPGTGKGPGKSWAVQSD